MSTESKVTHITKLSGGSSTHFGLCVRRVRGTVAKLTLRTNDTMSGGPTISQHIYLFKCGEGDA